jgi:hypothetical protein
MTTPTIVLPSTRNSRRASVFFYRPSKATVGAYHVERVFVPIRRKVRATWVGPFATAQDAKTAILRATQHPLTVTLEHEPVCVSNVERESLDAVYANKFVDLDQAESYLRQAFPGWFVYRGGSHVALHLVQGGFANRVLVITEPRA